MSDQADTNEMLVTLTADIVAAHVSNNSVAISDLAMLINNVHSALSGLGNQPVEEEKPVPAVSIRASVKPDHIVCLEDGKRSEEHTSELQSLMRKSYAVFCLKKDT